jgi:prevent-host-death family protein
MASIIKRLQIAEDILTLDDLSHRTAEVVRELRARSRPLIVTDHGKPAAVLLTPEDFDRLTYQERFLAAVHEGLIDSENGRTLSETELSRELDQLVGPLEAE